MEDMEEHANQETVNHLVPGSIPGWAANFQTLNPKRFRVFSCPGFALPGMGLSGCCPAFRALGLASVANEARIECESGLGEAPKTVTVREGQDRILDRPNAGRHALLGGGGSSPSPPFGVPAMPAKSARNRAK